MAALLYNIVTGALIVIMINAAKTMVDLTTLRSRRIPWVAITLTVLVIIGLVLQTTWSGATDALDSNPAHHGWWRPLTSVFIQSPGLMGRLWNLVTIAIIGAFAEWFWGSRLTAAVFLAGALLPHYIGVLLLGSHNEASTNPRNFCGSSGATYFLGAALTGALLLAATSTPQRLLALAVPALGLLTWFLQDNAHGLVSAEGWVLGLLIFAALRPRWTFNRDLVHAPRTPIGALLPR